MKERYRHANQMVKSEQLEGYFVVPSEPTISVNGDGEVISELDGVPLPKHVSGDYLAVASPASGKSVYIHRLMADTYLTPSDGDDKSIVNHIDGRKHNNVCANLEWTNYSGNLTHAFIAGLRDDNQPVEVMDLRTGDIVAFLSYQECGRHFGRNAERIKRYVDGSRSVPFMLYYSIRKVGESWPDLTTDDVGVVGNGHSLPVVAVAAGGGPNYIFTSAGQAARELGISVHSIRRVMNTDVVVGEYRFTHGSRYRGRLDGFIAPDAKHQSPPKRKPRRVSVTNTITDSTHVYESIKQFADEVGSTKAAVSKSVWRNDGRWRDYSIKYL